MASFMDIDSAAPSDYTNNVIEFTIDSKNTDGSGDQDETFYQNTKWSQQFGNFISVADLKSALILKATWNVGKGYTADSRTQVILEHITGWGKDTFDDILFNMEVTKRIGGDAYCEIIRDGNIIVNLKPLDPGSMRIIVDRSGIIKRYEQTSKVKGTPNKKFKPEDILHFSNNRLADQIHGISDIDAIEKVIKAEGESFEDVKKIMHRGARPMILWKLKTDDTAKIARFVAKINAARNLGEDMFIPDDDDTVTHEIIQVDVNAGLIAWRDDLRNKFYRTIGLPQIVPGGGGQSTESESKVIYLAFEQIVEKDQREIEQNIWHQLGLKINLYPPATLSAQLQSDTAKDGNNAFQQSDLIAGAGR